MFKLMKFDQDAMVDFRSRTAENEWGRGRGGALIERCVLRDSEISI